MESGSAFLTTSGGDLTGLRPRLEKFGRYFLVDRLAVGGMAEVYRAVTHGVEGFRRTFVVKRILAEKASSATFIRMFCEEARISALLHHPNVVQVYDFGHVAGSYFLAMEYLPGKDLSSLMRVLRAAKTAVPPELAAYVAREAAMGLHYAHTLRSASGQPLGIVHRDVTPSNIMLLFAGGVKVLDFGIAKTATEPGDGDGGGGIKGKFGYLSPEQARGGDIDGRSDVFALGVTLWEMLVGRRLFAAKDEVETLRNVLQKPIPSPSSLRPEVPPELDRIVLRALERVRERRYQTAEELALDCDRVVRAAHADSQNLRGFLNDLFAEESSALSFESPEIPEELLAAAMSGAIPAPSSTSAVPRDDQSLEIEVIDSSAPHGRARNPAPPFGVIASEVALLRASGRWAKFGRPALWACSVALVAGLLVGVALRWQARHAPRASLVATSPARPASPPPPSPREEAPIDVAAPAAQVVAPEASAAAPTVRSAEPRPRARRSGHGPRARARALTPDLTLDPF